MMIIMNIIMTIIMIKRCRQLRCQNNEVSMIYSMKSAGLAKPRSPARRRGLAATAMLLALVATIGAGWRAQAAANDAAAKTIFEKFVAAQNAHDSDAVKAMLLDSPSTVLFARGVDTRGRDAVAARFKEYYEGTWHLEPDMSKFRVAVFSNDVVQILVPIVFTRGLPGKAPQQNTFMISQTYVQDANGWHIASILPVANTELK
jgi:ketosteroid isomerase-like protein